MESSKSISFDSIVMDVCCHPTRDMVAVGDIDGQVSIHSYGTSGTNHELMSFSYHKKSCRCVRFNSDGTQLVTASKDKSIRLVDMSSGTVTHSIKKAHDCAIFCLLLVNDNIAATGDDDGHLKVWDMRYRKPVMEIKENDDFLSDMVVDSTGRILLATSGEGTLTAFDIRKHKMLLQSELLDSGLLSLAIVKNGTKVVCGSEEGVLHIFNWDEWGNISDRFPGHPMSIDAIVPLGDSIVCTGASDGVIRSVSILPNRIVGTVGEHAGFPVEALSLSHCGRWLASCSHDQQVKFSDVHAVPAQKVDGHKRLRRKARPKSLRASTSADSSSFFADLGPPADNDGNESGEGCDGSDGSDSVDDDSSDSEWESGAGKKPKSTDGETDKVSEAGRSDDKTVSETGDDVSNNCECDDERNVDNETDSDDARDDDDLDSGSDEDIDIHGDHDSDDSSTA